MRRTVPPMHHWSRPATGRPLGAREPPRTRQGDRRITTRGVPEGPSTSSARPPRSPPARTWRRCPCTRTPTRSGCRRSHRVALDVPAPCSRAYATAALEERARQRRCVATPGHHEAVDHPDVVARQLRQRPRPRQPRKVLPRAEPHPADGPPSPIATSPGAGPPRRQRPRSSRFRRPWCSSSWSRASSNTGTSTTSGRRRREQLGQGGPVRGRERNDLHARIVAVRGRTGRYRATGPARRHGRRGSSWRNSTMSADDGDPMLRPNSRRVRFGGSMVRAHRWSRRDGGSGLRRLAAPAGPAAPGPGDGGCAARGLPGEPAQRRAVRCDGLRWRRCPAAHD